VLSTLIARGSKEWQEILSLHNFFAHSMRAAGMRLELSTLSQLVGVFDLRLDSMITVNLGESI
jgi:hypothetical protein